MCGRYSLTADTEELVEVFEVPTWPDPPLTLPRYNIAPTQMAPTLVLGPEGRRLGELKWGLVPFWADDPSVGNRMINARGESVDRKPAFREAFARRRCLVVADGFYEWKAPDEGSGPKTPYWIHQPDGRPFTFAGLWERWGPKESPLHTFTIVTTSASPWMRALHDRMPVVIGPEDRDRWMSRKSEADPLKELLRAAPDDTFQAYPVSTLVNRPANDDRACIEPVGEPVGPGAPPD